MRVSVVAISELYNLTRYLITLSVCFLKLSTPLYHTELLFPLALYAMLNVKANITTSPHFLYFD